MDDGGEDWAYSDGGLWTLQLLGTVVLARALADILNIDTVGRQRFNATLLDQYGYIIYSNNTISNYSNCFLAFGGYIPTIISNGSVYNASNCETPVRPIRARAAVGIGTAVIFCVLLVLLLAALNKHGKSHLPVEKRFRLVGRRWPWYWCIVTATCGIISGFTSIDVDRVWVLGTSAIFHFIFYLVSLPTCLAAIWEMSRNWGSFEERKGIDEDFFRYKQDDSRSKIEFYEPLAFYLFNFLAFFLSILRNWNPIARSNASVITDGRFQASSILEFLSWSVVVVAHIVSLHYYHPRTYPWKIPIALLLILIRIGFNIGGSFEYSFSQLRYQANPAYIFGLGYLPVILVLLVILFSGWSEPNEDQELLRLRTIRNASLDQQLTGIKSKSSSSERKSASRSKSSQQLRESRHIITNDYWSDNHTAEAV